MDNATKEKLNILAGISSIEFFIRSKAMKSVEAISNIHPMLKLFFDSELNSEIEKNTLISMTEAIIGSIEAFTEKGKFSNFRSIGVSIAQSLNKTMYFAKIIHHANTGRITIEQFYDLAAEYIAAESANIINQLWDFVGADLPHFINSGLTALLVFLQVDPLTAEWITGLIDSAVNVAYSYVKKFITQEEIQEFIHDTLEYTIESARKLFVLIDAAAVVIKENYHKGISKLKSWGRRACNYIGIETPSFLKEEAEKKKKKITIKNPYKPIVIVGGKIVNTRSKGGKHKDKDKNVNKDK